MQFVDARVALVTRLSSGLRIVRNDLVILDELGYLPFSQAGGALLFAPRRLSRRPVGLSQTGVV